MLGPFEKSVILQTMDNHWREHLSSMDHLRQGIHLRGYAQKDPKQEYKREAFDLFETLLRNIRYEILRLLTCVELDSQDEWATLEEQQSLYMLPSTAADQKKQPLPPQNTKIGRNTLCPCGSGMKYKYCHGQLT